jgi:hypothetical protein
MVAADLRLSEELLGDELKSAPGFGVMISTGMGAQAALAAMLSRDDALHANATRHACPDSKFAKPHANRKRKLRNQETLETP